MTTPTAHGYLRLSPRPLPNREGGLGTAGQEAISLASQREKIMGYYQGVLAPKGIAWGRFYEDGDTSGRVPMEQREAGLRLILDANRGDHIVFAKLDRAFRRVYDAVKTLDQWSEQGVIYHALDLGIDSSTPSGQMIVQIMAVFAEFERKIISVRTKEALDILRQQGRRVGRTAPWGWKWRGKKANAVLVPDEPMREIGAHIVKWHNDGATFEHIYFHMRELKIKHPYATRQNNDNGGWCLQAIKNAYHGMLRLKAHEESSAKAEN